MVSQLSLTATLWRWIGAAALLTLGGGTLRMGKNGPEVLFVLLLGAGLAGLEVYLRISRKTLRVESGFAEIFVRGKCVGSYYARDAQYASWLSRARSLAGSLLLPVLPFAIGGFNLATGQNVWGAGLILLGAASVAASVWDFKRLWLIFAPKPDGGTRELLLQKSDVIRLLGFWPADAAEDGRGGPGRPA